MTSPINWLVRLEQIVCLKMVRVSKEINDSFQALAIKREIGDRSANL